MNVETVLSNKENSLEELRKQTNYAALKFMKGIHHKCTAHHLFAHAHEYVFDLNEEITARRFSYNYR